MFFSHFGSLRAKFLTKSRISNRAGCRIPRLSQWVAKLLIPDNIFFQVYLGPGGDGCRKELNDPLENPMFLHMHTAGEFQ